MTISRPLKALKNYFKLLKILLSLLKIITKLFYRSWTAYVFIQILFKKIAKIKKVEDIIKSVPVIIIFFISCLVANEKTTTDHKFFISNKQYRHTSEYNIYSFIMFLSGNMTTLTNNQCPLIHEDINNVMGSKQQFTNTKIIVVDITGTNLCSLFWNFHHHNTSMRPKHFEDDNYHRFLFKCGNLAQKWRISWSLPVSPQNFKRPLSPLSLSLSASAQAKWPN